MCARVRWLQPLYLYSTAESSSTSTPQSPQLPQARVSLLEHLKCPTKSELSRKRKIEKPTATGSSTQANKRENRIMLISSPIMLGIMLLSYSSHDISVLCHQQLPQALKSRRHGCLAATVLY